MTYDHFAAATDCLTVAVWQDQYVLVFSFDGKSTLWRMNGSKIDSESASEDEADYNLALSSDGSVIVIDKRAFGKLRGRVQIFSEHSEEG